MQCCPMTTLLRGHLSICRWNYYCFSNIKCHGCSLKPRHVIGQLLRTALPDATIPSVTSSLPVAIERWKWDTTENNATWEKKSKCTKWPLHPMIILSDCGTSLKRSQSSKSNIAITYISPLMRMGRDWNWTGDL